jgi:ABC-type multidrug transport system fused ATPase/permease subunit
LVESISFRSLIFTALFILTCILTVFVIAYTLMYSFFQFGLLSYVLIAAAILSGVAAYSLYASGKVRIHKLLLGLGLLAVVALTIYATWFVLAPNWVFGLSTDKSSYTLGERVQITVTLENHGFVPQSITSPTTNPVVVAVYARALTVTTQMWYSPYLLNETSFSISPGQPLVRTFVWNQTSSSNPEFWNTTYMAGPYLIEAFIPKSRVDFDVSSRLFNAYVYINVTAT